MSGRRDNQTQTLDPAEKVEPLCPKDNEVLIRMYGQGVGDCFLLAFPRTRPTAKVREVDPNRPVYVLIDCGVLARTPDPTVRMRDVVADIRRTTHDPSLDPTADGKAMGHLDLLIITHEHWDHLSGFIYADARKEWDGIQIDALWTSWTARDDPEGLAGVLGKLREQQEVALKRITERVEGMRGAQAESLLQTVDDVISFLAESRDFAASTRSGLDEAKDRVKRVKGEHICCDPGDVRPIPGTDSVAYVLGPPQDWKRLSKMDPSRKEPETYGGEDRRATGRGSADDDLALARRALTEPSAFSAFVTPLFDPPGDVPAGTPFAAAPRPARDVYERTFPFDQSVSVPIPVAESGAAALPETYPALNAYFDEINEWRRIDLDWLMAAEGFALWVDSFINNTSLVLAFELPDLDEKDENNGKDKKKAKDNEDEKPERKVLLFVADAQVGNWLSWDELGPWKPRDGARGTQTAKSDMEDLLQRTVFYKVGHHGSHNATLKAKGVERMRTDGELIAFVPVSPAVAHEVGWEEMPLTEVLDALSTRTNGRVVFPDGNVWPPLEEEALEETWKRIGLEVSSLRLPAKVVNRKDDDPRDPRIEGEVPLWVQMAVEY